MKEYVITVDVYAHWGDKPPRYRVFVDNDMLTERDFLWSGGDTYIRENIIVNLSPGPHKLSVKQVAGSGGNIDPKNITLNGAPSSMDFFTS